MAARPVPLGHKEGAAREHSRMVAVYASQLPAKVGAQSPHPSGGNRDTRIANARKNQQRKLHRRVQNAKHSARYLRPATQNRAMGQFNNEPNVFGSRG